MRWLSTEVIVSGGEKQPPQACALRGRTATSAASAALERSSILQASDMPSEQCNGRAADGGSEIGAL
jgi:hypothetical protein